EAFRRQPALADGRPSVARAVAAMMALQASLDALDTPADLYSPVRARMRAQAHDWLRDEAAACDAALRRGGADAEDAREALDVIRRGYALSAFREQSAQAYLTLEERRQWARVFAAIDRLLAPPAMPQAKD